MSRQGPKHPQTESIIMSHQILYIYMHVTVECSVIQYVRVMGMRSSLTLESAFIKFNIRAISIIRTHTSLKYSQYHVHAIKKIQPRYKKCTSVYRKYIRDL